MTKVSVTKTIDAPLEKVFATWNDEYGDIYKFSPGLSHSQLLENSPAPSGKGALRHCDLKDGKNWLHERLLIMFRPTGKS